MHANAPIGVDTEPSLVRKIAGPMKPICETNRESSAQLQVEHVFPVSHIISLLPTIVQHACMHLSTQCMTADKWIETISKYNIRHLM